MSRRSVFYLSGFIVLCVVFLSTPAGADWVIQGRDGEASYLSKGRIKVVSGGKEKKAWYILESKSGRMTFVDEETKVYASATAEEYCRLARTMAEEMKEAMQEEMSPEERRQYERQMREPEARSGKGDLAPPKRPRMSITKTGTDIIAGRKTEKYTIVVDGMKYEDLWILVDASFTREMRELESSMVSAMTRFEKCGAGAEEDENDPHLTPEYKKLIDRGFVMKEAAYTGEGNETDVVSEVVKLERKKIPAAEFMVPKGYRKLPLREFIRGQADEDEEGPGAE